MNRFKVMKLTAGKYPAPLKILSVVETGITKGLDQGYLEESEVNTNSLTDYLE